MKAKRLMTLLLNASPEAEVKIATGSGGPETEYEILSVYTGGEGLIDPKMPIIWIDITRAEPPVKK